MLHTISNEKKKTQIHAATTKPPSAVTSVSVSFMSSPKRA